MDPGEVREEKEPLIIDWIIAAYAAVVLLVQILFLISPVMTFFSKTPLYSIQTYLGFLGGVLILIDMFTSRGLWRGAYCIFLYAICALAAVAAVRMIDYGMKENIYKLCWTAIQIALIYSCAYRLKRKQWRKCILYFYAGLVTIWFAACCVSLYQYVLQIGYTYVVNPLAQDPSVSRQGFYDNRLFGIFSTLNHAAFVSVFFFLIGLIYLIKARKVVWKVILGVVELVLGCHILLSGSRSALVAVLVCLLCLFWYFIRNRSKYEGWRRNIISGVLAALLTALCAFGVRK